MRVRQNQALWTIGSLLLLAHKTSATLRRYELNITSSMINPDCHNESYPALLVNGRFPGPAIHAVKDDDVEILVNNQVENNASTTIHFHGIRQYGSVESDGVPDVTQAAIAPGESFLHRFRVVHQSGTYFYHAHAGMQDDTVQGPLIVFEDERSIPEKDTARTGKLVDGPHEYDDELTLQLSEWWHQPFSEREDYYFGSDFSFDHGANSVLMNGKTIFDPTKMSEKCRGYSGFSVLPNQTYRLRVIGATTFRTYGLAIKDHNMTIIEVDGELTQPYETSYIEVTPGQRFSVLVHTGNHTAGSNFAIATSYRYRHRGGGYTENGFGYLRYARKDTKPQRYIDFKPTTFPTVARPAERAGGGGGRPNGGERPDTKGNGAHGGQGNDTMSHGGSGNHSGGKDGGNASRPGDDGHGKGPAGRPSGEGHEEGPGRRASGDGHGEGPGEHGGREGGRGGNGGGGRGGEGGGRGGEGSGRGGEGGGRGGEGGGRGGEGSGRGGGGGGWGDRQPEVKEERKDLPKFPAEDNRDWIWPFIKPVRPRDPILDRPADRTIMLRSHAKKQADNTTRYMMNDRLPIERHSPIMHDIYNRKRPSANFQRLEADGYDSILNTYPLQYNETVDIVFQNTVSGQNCLIHPWHTHGHSHYVIATGDGEYSQELDKDVRNYPNPVYKDVSTVYPTAIDEATQGCGWTKIRLLADNPGIWAIHCHITSHMLQGKMVVFEEAPELISSKRIYAPNF